MADAEIPSAAWLAGAARCRPAVVDAQHREGRIQPEPEPVAHLQAGDRKLAALGEHIARVEERDAAHPLEDGKPGLLIQREQRVAALRQSEKVEWAEAVFRVPAHGVAAPRAEPLRRNQVVRERGAGLREGGQHHRPRLPEVLLLQVQLRQAKVRSNCGRGVLERRRREPAPLRIEGVVAAIEQRRHAEPADVEGGVEREEVVRAWRGIVGVCPFEPVAPRDLRPARPAPPLLGAETRADGDERQQIGDVDVFTIAEEVQVGRDGQAE